MISHTQIPVFVCVKDGGMLRKRFDFRKHTTYIIGQMYEILRCFCFKRLYWSLVDMYVKLSTSDRDYILAFFQYFLCGGTPRSQYTCLPVSICSHTQELTPYELLNMSIISLNFTNLPFLSWSHSSAH